MTAKRVMVIDDSALMRQLLTKIVNSDPGLEVVATARDPYEAWEKLQKCQVDVLTLDVEMPRMDGVAFLEKLMYARPMPVVMISTLTEKGCQTTLRALEVGAVDFVSKPKLDVQQGTADMAGEIIAKVKAACFARPRPYRPGKVTPVVSAASSGVGGGALIQSTHKVIAIGASTGGTEALYQVLTAMPADCAGIVIVQHMPGKFTRSFAERLDRASRISVKEASDRDRILPGQALLAPGGFHMEVQRQGATYEVRITDTEPVNRFKPSVDVLFRSCVKHLGKHTTAAILTGMGRDGADGMRELYDSGAHTIAQNEETCVVFGMPKEAIATGGVRDTLPLEKIAARLYESSAADGRRNSGANPGLVGAGNGA